mmetsp:Transcript_25225/g.74148  ORF Transcript_25225/g.74148 Transcript_25225/m.74148 type:complete len:113 (+) Transcript_25225:1386-1724(+)
MLRSIGEFQDLRARHGPQEGKQRLIPINDAIITAIAVAVGVVVLLLLLLLLFFLQRRKEALGAAPADDVERVRIGPPLAVGREFVYRSLVSIVAHLRRHGSRQFVRFEARDR